MSGVATAMIGSSVIGGLLSSNAQKQAAQTAANAQTQANQAALAAQQQNYAQGTVAQQTALNAGNTVANAAGGQLSQVFAPYVAAGQAAIPGLQQYAQGGLNAFGAQQNLAGANGNDAQSAAISQFQNSPMFQQLNQQGINTILQNASANGNLRSGNAVAQEAQFSPALLQSLLQQQFTNLGTLSGLGSQSQNSLAALGQGSAAGQAQGAVNISGQQLGLQGQVASNIASLSGANTQAVTGLLGQEGQIGANNALAQGAANQGLFSGIGSSVNLAALLKSGLFGNNANAGAGAAGGSGAGGGWLGPGEGASLPGTTGISYLPSVARQA